MKMTKKIDSFSFKNKSCDKEWDSSSCDSFRTILGASRIYNDWTLYWRQRKKNDCKCTSEGEIKYAFFVVFFFCALLSANVKFIANQQIYNNWLIAPRRITNSTLINKKWEKEIEMLRYSHPFQTLVNLLKLFLLSVLNLIYMWFTLLLLLIGSNWIDGTNIRTKLKTWNRQSKKLQIAVFELWQYVL